MSEPRQKYLRPVKLFRCTPRAPCNAASPLNCPVIMSSSAAYQHAHTVHGASHFAERWLKAPIRTPFGSSVHGGSGGSFKMKLYGGGSLAPPQSLVLEDLDNDAIMTIGHVSGVAGALLAQCCARIHHVLRPSLEARLVRFVDKGILFNDMQETRTLARQYGKDSSEHRTAECARIATTQPTRKCRSQESK